MRQRTRAREFALQILYQIDMTKDNPQQVLENFWQDHKDLYINDSVKNFTNCIVIGVIQNLDTLNEKIAKYAKNWQLKRMAVVDRNILRLGSFELLYLLDIPPKVALNEAIELTKRFSGVEASKFVNGILDKIKTERP